MSQVSSAKWRIRKEVVVLDPRDIVAYAHRIAGTTSAPKEWQPGLRLNFLFDVVVRVEPLSYICYQEVSLSELKWFQVISGRPTTED
ncbi:unnamed protein product [Peronospora belbahrii]|uniref:Uncharacterized protein n=1 Tax=Peronospora belbahrii TaxID=622444 RepID=A0ABN8CNA3_9STRA|nr:unnamed protein product [Peronospora belbahrii]